MSTISDYGSALSGALPGLRTEYYGKKIFPSTALYILCDVAYNFVKELAPKKVRDFIEEHPVYSAGLEGIVLGTVLALLTVGLVRKFKEK